MTLRIISVILLLLTVLVPVSSYASGYYGSATSVIVVPPDEGPPGACAPGSVYIVNGELLCCAEDAVTLSACNPTPVTELPPLLTPTAFSPGVTETATSIPLCLHHTVGVTTNVGGVVLTVPAASNLACGGEFYTEIVDTGGGPLTLIPTGTDTLSYAAGSPSPISGQKSFYHIRRTSTTSPGNWSITATTPVVSDAPVIASCTLFGGDTNTATGSADVLAHSLTCTTPANFFTAKKGVDLCVSWKMTTGSTSPNILYRLKAGTTVTSLTVSASSTDGFTDRSITWCWNIMASAAPSASSAVYTGLITRPGASSNGADMNTTVQPVNLATDAPITWTMESEWSAAGTGTSAVTQQRIFMRVP